MAYGSLHFSSSLSLSLKKLTNPSSKPNTSFLIHSAKTNRLQAMNAGSIPQQATMSASAAVLYMVPDMESDQMDRIAEEAFRRYSSSLSSSAKRCGNGVAIVWFRNDLRVLDNEVLLKAWMSSQAVLPVYCIDPRLFGSSYYFGFPKTGGKTSVLRTFVTLFSLFSIAFGYVKMILFFIVWFGFWFF